LAPDMNVLTANCFCWREGKHGKWVPHVDQEMLTLPEHLI